MVDTQTEQAAQQVHLDHHDNAFYRKRFHQLWLATTVVLGVMLLLLLIVLYQILHRPLPKFVARTVEGKQMSLVAYSSPNQSSTTIIRWASQAAVAAYTFDFHNYAAELARVQPYFTPEGWVDFRASVSQLLQTVQQNQLFINGVVSSPPTIASQGALAGGGYAWHIQIPFLATYQSSEKNQSHLFLMHMTVTRVPTSINPQGVGIDQIVMEARQ